MLLKNSSVLSYGPCRSTENAGLGVSEASFEVSERSNADFFNSLGCSLKSVTNVVNRPAHSRLSVL